jgi:hypothetical protein
MLRLRSLYQDVVWPPDGPLQSACYFSTEASWNERTGKHEDELSPWERCTCGIYALHAPPERPGWHALPHNLVHGILIGYGKLIEGERGFRASKARPVALLREHANASIVERLAQAYGARVMDRWPDVPPAGSAFFAEVA